MWLAVRDVLWWAEPDQWGLHCNGKRPTQSDFKRFVIQMHINEWEWEKHQPAHVKLLQTPTMIPASLILAYDDYLALKIDPKKLVMGVPWYGYDYPCVNLSQVWRVLRLVIYLQNCQYIKKEKKSWGYISIKFNQRCRNIFFIFFLLHFHPLTSFVALTFILLNILTGGLLH